jgi:hypothetical protein
MKTGAHCFTRCVQITSDFTVCPKLWRWYYKHFEKSWYFIHLLLINTHHLLKSICGICDCRNETVFCGGPLLQMVCNNATRHYRQASSNITRPASWKTYYFCHTRTDLFVSKHRQNATCLCYLLLLSMR